MQEHKLAEKDLEIDHLKTDARKIKADLKKAEVHIYTVVPYCHLPFML